MALSSAQRIELIQKMYVAYYGRPADTGGLDNWINHLARNNDDASAIIQAFGTSPEATSLYGDPVDYAFAVNALYMQMFNRPAEPDGLALYVAHLNAGRVTLPNLALTIAQGARNSDLTTLTNKIEVATAFTEELATSTENILGYSGEDAAAHAAAYLASVTDVDASVIAALADLDSTINTINGLDQLSSLPTHELTTALDNLLGSNGNDVVLANLTSGPNGEEVTLELDDAFNALLGQDTLRLDAWGGVVSFDSTELHMEGFERVLVQARGDNEDDLALSLDLEDMVGVDLEVRNMDGGLDGLWAFNIGGDAQVTNFDGYFMVLDNVGGDVSLSDITFDGNNEDINISNVGGSVTLTAIDGFNGENDSNLNIDNVVGDVTINGADLDNVFIQVVGGSINMVDFYLDGELEIDDVTENVTLTGELDENGNINTIINEQVNIDTVGGDVIIENIDGIDFLQITGVGGNVELTNFDVDGNINIYAVDGSLTLTGNVDAEGALDTYISGDVDINGVGGNVTITDIDFDENLNLNEIAGNTVTFNNVYTDDNIEVNFADSVTRATINFNGLDAYEGEYLDIDGINVTKYTFNVTEDSNVNEIHLDHNNNSLSEVVINLNADLIIDRLTVASAVNSNDVNATWTVNGAGNLVINSIADDDNLDLIYKGSGSILIGEGDGNSNNSAWEPQNGSFNGSQATGSVEAYLDLDQETALDFTYVGARGNDRIIIEEGTLGNAASNAGTVALSLAGGTGVDTLVVSDDSDLTEDAMAVVSGFEVLELRDLDSNEIFDLAETHEFTSVVLSDSDSNDNNVAVINLSATQAQNMSILLDGYDSNSNDKTMFNDLDISLENTLGISDVVDLTVVVDGSVTGESASGWWLGNNVDTDGTYTLVDEDLIIDEVETFNIEVTGDAFYRDGLDALTTNTIDVYIDVLDGNELETLNISGGVSLEFGDINANDLRVIDARTFTGAYLGLGTEGDVFTNDDLTIYGSLTAEHNIDVNINDNEDLVITTGSGDDDINAYGEGLQEVTISSGDGIDYIEVDDADGDVSITSGSGYSNIDVNSNADVTISSGDGDSNIDVNTNGNVTITSGSGADDIWVSTLNDVVITSGAGNDDVYIDYADDVTVTLGDGNDSFDYNDDNIYEDLIINAGAGSDDINIYLDSDSNINSVTVTLGADADDLWLYSTRWDAANDVVVTVTDFAVAQDTIYLDENANFGEGAEYVTVSTADGDYDLSDVLSASDIGVVEFTFAADNNAVALDINSDGSDLLLALGDDGDAIITVDDDQNGYIVAYNGGQAFIFNFEDQAELDATVSQLQTAQSNDENNQTENWTLTLTANAEGFDAGDIITLSNIQSFNSGIDFTYTVQQDETSVSEIASAIANAINDLSGSDFYATYEDGYIYMSSRTDLINNDSVVIGYNNVNDTATINAGEIELIGVLQNVTAGSLTINNFDFGNIIL